MMDTSKIRLEGMSLVGDNMAIKNGYTKLSLLFAGDPSEFDYGAIVRQYQPKSPVSSVTTDEIPLDSLRFGYLSFDNLTAVVVISMKLDKDRDLRAIKAKVTVEASGDVIAQLRNVVMSVAYTGSQSLDMVRALDHSADEDMPFLGDDDHSKDSEGDDAEENFVPPID